MVADPSTPYHPCLIVDDGHVVVTFGPVDAACLGHTLSSQIGSSVRAKDLRGTLMAALTAQHLTSRLQTQQPAVATVYIEVCNDR
jgi:hypothetical protein